MDGFMMNIYHLIDLICRNISMKYSILPDMVLYDSWKLFMKYIYMYLPFHRPYTIQTYSMNHGIVKISK